MMPWTARLAVVLCALGGAWLLAEALSQRITGVPLVPAPWALWLPIAAQIGLGPYELGWEWNVAGSTMLGAAFALYLRRPWGWMAALAGAALAAPFLWPGTVLALLIAACIADPRVRQKPVADKPA
jgi:hypothetical protein